MMDEISEGLRYIFQTDSKYTCLISGPGHAGMEAAIANLIEPGETIVVGNKGIWGARVCDLSARYGANVVNMEVAPGKSFDFATIKEHVERHRPAALFLVHGESSTGVHQDLTGLGELCRKHNCLLIVDTVCTLGGVPLLADQWGIDCIYSGSQKCLSGPPGTSPFFMSDKAGTRMGLARPAEGHGSNISDALAPFVPTSCCRPGPSSSRGRPSRRPTRWT